MSEYKHIEKVLPQEDGTTNLLLRGNKHAIIELTKKEGRFKAAVYHLFTGYPPEEPKKRRSLLAQFYHDGSKEAFLTAVGWVDENPAAFLDWQEMDLPEEDRPMVRSTNLKRANLRRVKKGIE